MNSNFSKTYKMKLYLFVFVYLIALSCFGQGNYTMFFVEANNVNVREFPSSKSKSLGKIPERTTVTWLDSVQTTNEIINWNGKDVKGKWYKISADINKNSVEGWIFEKTFDFEKRVQYFHFEENEEKNIDFSKGFENEIIKITPSSQDEFEQLDSSSYMVYNTKKFQNCFSLILPLKNGKKHEINQNIYTDKNNYADIFFCAEIEELNLYALEENYEDSSVFKFIKKENGLVINANAFTGLSMNEKRSAMNFSFSPNHEITVLGDYFGICFVDIINYKSVTINCDLPVEFRWRDSKSGIAYLISQKHWNNEPIKESFFKFTLK